MKDKPDLDLDCVEQARRGDPEAFGRIVKATLNRIWALAWRLSGRREEAADLVQETYVRAFKAIHAFRGEAGICTWLYRIEVNCHFDSRKRAARGRAAGCAADGFTPEAEPPDPPDNAAGPPQQLQDKEDAELLRRALETLDARQREILCLRTLEGLSYEEIAGVLGVPAGTVGTWLYRARADLLKAYLRLTGAKR